MTILATRRRFGRYVFAIGGNPDAAEPRRHQHEAHDHDDVRRHGHPERRQRGGPDGPAQRRDGRPRDPEPSCTSSRRRSSAARRSPVASGRSRAPCSAPSSCSRCSRAWSCFASTRRSRTSSSGSSSSPRSASTRTSGGAGMSGGMDIGSDAACSRRRSRPVHRRTESPRRSSRCATSGSSFGGVHAVEGVSVDLLPGEVIGLVGGNGAGKSTLMRVLSGAQRADSGEVRVDGTPVTISNPRDAKALGIETIYQTLALADNVDAAANVFLGRELQTRLRQPGRRRDGIRDPQGHGAAQPALPELQDGRAVAVGRSAPGDRDRPRDPFQREGPDHGRADGGPRAGRDGPGPRAGRAAEAGRDRHLPDQPRHPRRVRPGRPDHASCSRARSSGPSTRDR